MIIDTQRLRLRHWRESDRENFSAMNADPEVVADLGGPINARASDAKFDRYCAHWERHGFGRWLVETRSGEFLGYSGVMASHGDHPLGAHYEMGWRLVRPAWGKGYATEASRAALDDAFARLNLTEILAYTAPDNLRSQAVMAHLGLTRDPARDFTLMQDGAEVWRGLVWSALA